MSEIRIVHLIHGLSVGGAEMMLYKLLSETDRQCFRSSVISLLEIGPIGKQIEELDIPVHALGMGRKHPNLGRLRTLLRLLRQERPQILQTWAYPANLLGLFIGKIALVPHIVWNVRSSNPSMQDYSRRTIGVVKATARLSRRPNAVIINSEAGRAFHTSLGYRPRRWEVIPNGFDLERFAPNTASFASVRAELGLTPDTILIGLIGRYHPLKDYDNFMRAAGHLTRQQPGCHFLLAGRDVISENVALRQQIAETAIGPYVHLLGERADVPRLMAALDILTLSSSSEGFPNVVGEGMACGIPCVVTDVGDSAAIVGETGIVVPPKNPEALAGGWQQLIEVGSAERLRRGQAARERIRQNYSLERIVQRYEDLYTSLL